MISETSLPKITIGHAHNDTLRSGVTVIKCTEPCLAAVDVRGAAPGTRETDLLRLENFVNKIDALVLSGGSAFGLDAASGVVEMLRASSRGYPVGPHRVPIVPSAILFDLANGGEKHWEEASPYALLGKEAFSAAGRKFALGSVGAGAGATIANLRGGFGYAEALLVSGHMIAACVAVNAAGQVTMGDGPHFWAAPFEEESEFGGLGWPAERAPEIRAIRVKTPIIDGANTTIGCVLTNAPVDQLTLKRLAISAHDGLARAIWPCHLPSDGDVMFAMGVGKAKVDSQDVDLTELNAAASSVMSRAIALGVYHANPSPEGLLPSWQQQYGGDLN